MIKPLRVTLCLKSHRIRLFTVLSFLIVALIIYSCHKESQVNNSNQTTLSDNDIAQLKSVYNQGIISGSGFATFSVNNSLPAFIKNLNVNWNQYILGKLSDGGKTAEFDIQADTGLITLSDKQGSNLTSANKTVAVFLTKSDGTKLNFFMKVVEDFSQAPKSTIKDLHYRQIPTTFSGKVLFFTLDRKFINGYKYSAGKSIGSIVGIFTKSAGGKQVQSIKTPLKIEYVCEEDDYYWYECTNGVCDEGYLYTDYITCEANNPNNGGVQGGSGSGGGGGATGGPGGLAALMASNSNLTTQQINSIDSVLTLMIHLGCAQQALYNYLSSNALTVGFVVVDTISQQGLYTTGANTLTIKDPSNLSPATLFEELFHKFQSVVYQTGTKQSVTPPAGNIEFEAKLLHDIGSAINGGSFTMDNSDGYQDWLYSLTGVTSTIGSGYYPNSFTSDQSTKYYQYLGDFVNPSFGTGYSADAISYSSNPTAIFTLLNSTSSSCPLN